MYRQTSLHGEVPTVLPALDFLHYCRHGFAILNHETSPFSLGTSTLVKQHYAQLHTFSHASSVPSALLSVAQNFALRTFLQWQLFR